MTSREAENGTPATAASLLDLDDGFLALPRRLCASPFFRSLRADERFVVVAMLLAARYAEGGGFWFAGEWIPLAPGQFFDSQETIAAAAGTTRKVTRTVLRKCRAAGVIVTSRVHPAGQCPTVTTVVDYERIRYAGGEAGQRTGPRTGQQGASEGPANGPANGPHQNKGNKGTPEPGNPDNLLPPTPAAPAAASEERPSSGTLFVDAASPKEKRAEKKRPTTKEADPRHAPCRARLEATFREARGVPYTVQGGRDGKAVSDLLAYSGGDLDEIDRRWRYALGLSRYPGCARIAHLADRWNELVPGSGVIATVTAPASPASAFRGGRRDLSAEVAS